MFLQTLFCNDFATTNGDTLVEHLFSIYPNLWISACEVWNEILIRIVVAQEDTKIVLADIFINKYYEVVQQLIENNDKDQCSFHFMSIHLLISPSLNLQNIETSNALSQIAGILESSCSNQGLILIRNRYF